MVWISAELNHQYMKWIFGDHIQHIKRPTSSQAGEELNTSLTRDGHLFTLGFLLQCQK